MKKGKKELSSLETQRDGVLRLTLSWSVNSPLYADAEEIRQLAPEGSKREALRVAFLLGCRMYAKHLRDIDAKMRKKTIHWDAAEIEQDTEIDSVTRMMEANMASVAGYDQGHVPGVHGSGISVTPGMGDPDAAVRVSAGDMSHYLPGAYPGSYRGGSPGRQDAESDIRSQTDEESGYSESGYAGKTTGHEAASPYGNPPANTPASAPANPFRSSRDPDGGYVQDGGRHGEPDWRRSGGNAGGNAGYGNEGEA